MGQIESQIFSSSYVAKVILGTISPVQPKSDDAAGVCQAPAPVLRRAICFPGYPLAHRVRRRFFCGVATSKRRASSRLRSSQYQASSIACRCCSKRWRVAGDNCWHSRPETSKLSIVTETKFCFCFGVLSGVACGVQ